MSKQNETFFTSIGCIDGRAQEQILKFGRKKFRAKFADIITEAGLVGELANNPQQSLFDSIKQKLLISLEKHHSKGIVVHGHQECAGNQVEDHKHKEEIRKSVLVMKSLINSSVPVIGAFVKRSSQDSSKWEIEEISPTDFA